MPGGRGLSRSVVLPKGFSTTRNPSSPRKLSAFAGGGPNGHVISRYCGGPAEESARRSRHAAMEGRTGRLTASALGAKQSRAEDDPECWFATQTQSIGRGASAGNACRKAEQVLASFIVNPAWRRVLSSGRGLDRPVVADGLRDQRVTARLLPGGGAGPTCLTGHVEEVQATRLKRGWDRLKLPIMPVVVVGE